MNDCVNGDIRDVLPELVSGTLPAGDVARVQAHVRECADCAAEVELLRTARAAMRLAPTMDTTRIAAAVQASTSQRLAARRSPARVARIAALSLGVLAGAFGIWSMRSSTSGAPATTIAASGASTAGPASTASGSTAEPRVETPPAQLALGGDVSQLEDEQLLALMEEVSALEAMPGEDAAPLAIEPLLPVDEEEM